MRHEVSQSYVIEPGFVLVPSRPTALAAVVTSGVVVSLFDDARGRGGLCHYTEPYRRDGLSTAAFAAPSILCLVEMFRRFGSRPADLEAHLYGGAVNSECGRFREGLSEANVQVGLEVLANLDIVVAGRDIGGRRGRKIIFHAATGEVMVARLNSVSEADWYPVLGAGEPPGTRP